MNQKAAPTTRTAINHAIRATRTATKRYFIKPSENSIRTTTATRSKDSHLGIVIHRFGPACGRPQLAAAVIDPLLARQPILLGELGC